MNLLLDSLKETLLLWLQYFFIIAIVILVTVAPGKIFFWSYLLYGHKFWSDGLIVLGIIDVFMRSVQDAAVLGLILYSGKKVPVLQAMRDGVAAGWWKFMIINAGIGLAVVALAGNFLTVLLRDQNVVGMLVLMMAASSLLIALGYAKFGLTLPVIIMERLSLWAAVKRSWSMSKGDLGWIVLICFFILRMVSTVVSHFTQPHITPGHLPAIADEVTLGLVQAQVDSLFVILLAVLYQKFTRHEKVSEFFLKQQMPSS